MHILIHSTKHWCQATEGGKGSQGITKDRAGSLVPGKRIRIFNSLEGDCEQAKGEKEKPMLFSVFIVSF